MERAPHRGSETDRRSGRAEAAGPGPSAARPAVDLYVPDKRHPSLAGTYLTACTILASVMGVNPVGNAYTAGLDPGVAWHLQEIAWETVQADQR